MILPDKGKDGSADHSGIGSILATESFDCVPYSTDYQSMHASKPNPAYYREIAERLKRPAQECLMVENEVQMDILRARRAGMKTFWVTDAGGMATDVPADWRGTLADLGAWVESGELAD